MKKRLPAQKHYVQQVELPRIPRYINCLDRGELPLDRGESTLDRGESLSKSVDFHGLEDVSSSTVIKMQRSLRFQVKRPYESWKNKGNQLLI
jgi:hypothetical protein